MWAPARLAQCCASTDNFASTFEDEDFGLVRVFVPTTYDEVLEVLSTVLA